MQIYQAISQREAQGFNTQQLRDNFLIESIFQNNEITMYYTHYDRVVIGGAMPVYSEISLPIYDNLKSDYFLERREIGIINVGGDGEITVDGNTSAAAIKFLQEPHQKPFLLVVSLMNINHCHFRH